MFAKCLHNLVAMTNSHNSAVQLSTTKQFMHQSYVKKIHMAFQRLVDKTYFMSILALNCVQVSAIMPGSQFTL